MNSPTDLGLRPEEFAQAAQAAVQRATAQTEPHAMLGVLAQAGLCGIMAAPEDGGLGLDLAFALPIAEAVGQWRLPLPLAEHILLAHAFAGTLQAKALVAGERLGGIAWYGSMQTAYVRLDHAPADWVLLADGDGAALLDVRAVAPHTVQTSLDPENPQLWLEPTQAAVLARLDAASWAALQRQAHILLAQVVHGAAEGALQATADYMATRVQFGRVLSSKQAVRHHLARMRLVQEASAMAIHRLMSHDEFGAMRDARPALAGAIAQAVFVIEKAIHLHGGIGFTWELPLHQALRRVRKLDAAFGDLIGDVGRTFNHAVGASCRKI